VNKPLRITICILLLAALFVTGIDIGYAIAMRDCPQEITYVNGWHQGRAPQGLIVGYWVNDQLFIGPVVHVGSNFYEYTGNPRVSGELLFAHEPIQWATFPGTSDQ